MAPRIVDEREHRRGLILGLTLAEVLLLLLFLLMLALAVPLKKQIVEARSAEKQAVALRGQIEELKWAAKELADGQAEKLDQLRTRLQNLRNIETLMAAAKLGEAELRRLLVLVTSFSGASEMDTLELFLHEAARINPDDPPMTLKRALAFIQVAGKDVRPEHVSALSPMINSEESIGRFESIYQEATQINPADPPAALVKAVKEAQRSAQPGNSHSNDTAAGRRGKHNWPPIINLSEAGGYYFKSGSAELSAEFRNGLSGSIPEHILELAKQYDVDIIEVVGHTDEQPIGGRQSNLDRDLLAVLRGSADIASALPADNAGLGLARAVSVVSVLRQNAFLSGYKLLPLSGAQLIDTNETLATSGFPVNIRERRRIEIRLRKSTPHDLTVSALPTTPLTDAKPQRHKPAPSPPPRRPVPAVPWGIFPIR